MSGDLTPPRKSVELEDPGAHDLDLSSDEHFSDAHSAPDRSAAHSPIPLTRVERVDDKPSYGEVPGTTAYNMRSQDAVPDEVEIVPDGQRSRSASSVGLGNRPYTPGGSPVPRTVLEKVDDEPRYGDVPGTAAHELRKADAIPDVVVKVPEPPSGTDASALRTSGQPLNDSLRHDNDEAEDEDDTRADDSDDSGDDFDEFEEGEEAGAGGDDDDFGDFDDFEEGQGSAEFEEPPPTVSAPAPVPIAPSVPPILNFSDMRSPDDVTSASRDYVNAFFPSLHSDSSIQTTDEARSIFLSERSISLWSQLVAPPPLQPPNWVRSRIRRLFLVSLGVPVDLDEILPASKQKKLVLPSINLPGDRSPRPSSDDRGASGAVERLKKGNASSTSVDSSASRPGRSSKTSRRGVTSAPQFNASSTAILCSTTEEALAGFTDRELKDHVKKLEGLRKVADEALEYWGKRKESSIGDKEAFEAVIENLVKHAKKVRK